MFLNELNCWVPAISGQSAGWEQKSCLMSSLSQFGWSPDSWRRREEIINIHCRVANCQTCFPAVLLSLIVHVSDTSQTRAASTGELVKPDSGFLELMAQAWASRYGRWFYSWNGNKLDAPWTQIYIAEKPSCTLYLDKLTMDVRF